ncbi:hypothetical protein NIES2100_02320 [Calothrix sp. NIES-2100]|nr:hypothetical protein NIES2100_02320 [Calothrix sp. NIES-2100]
MNSQANSESPLKRTEDCRNLSSSPLERTCAIRLGIHSEAGWINSAKICVYTVAAIAAGSVNQQISASEPSFVSVSTFWLSPINSILKLYFSHQIIEKFLITRSINKPNKKSLPHYPFPIPHYPVPIPHLFIMHLYQN